MKLPQLDKDKANHVIYGQAIYIAARVGLSLAGMDPEYSRQAAAGLATLFGVLKEGHDWWQNKKAADVGAAPRHGVEYGDAVATAAGAWALFILGV